MYQIASWAFQRWEKIDEERGLRRFYEAEAKQDIFGTWLVVKSWGRIGQRASRTVVVEVASRDEALATLSEISITRAKHGYTEKP